jgi:hypothetical protein
MERSVSRSTRSKPDKRTRGSVTLLPPNGEGSLREVVRCGVNQNGPATRLRHKIDSGYDNYRSHNRRQVSRSGDMNHDGLLSLYGDVAFAQKGQASTTTVRIL